MKQYKNSQNLETKVKEIVGKIKGKEVEYLIKKGDAFYGAENFKEAIECYDKILAEDRDNLEVWLNKGNSLLYLRKLDESITSFDNIIKTGYSKYRSSAYIGKAAALYEQEKYEEAVEAMEKSRINDIGVRFALKDVKKKAAYQKAKWPKKVMLNIQKLFYD